ncbi:MAG: hypothetical protein A4E32_00216 [Methanomassiliicoccales archaeon PtaU1.Bin124]|nr:MAG: hypothetical protein A4E32_00216 [Methanomassiliicoccales archaeon PtaU1.Bin124]
MRVFLDYCMLNDAMRDASVLAKLRFMRKSGVELVTATSVIGEAVEVLADGPKEGHYVLMDLLHDLHLHYVHPRKDWLKDMARIDSFLDGKNATFVSASERTHMALAMSAAADMYITSRAEARNLSMLVGLKEILNVVDIDDAVAKVKAAGGA